MATHSVIPCPPAMNKMLGRKAKLYVSAFESPAEFGNECKATPRKNHDNDRSSWVDYKSYTDAANFAVTGNSERVKDSDKMLERFDAMGLATYGKQWVPSVVGGHVNMGAFMAGTPACMRQRIKVKGEASPIAIVVEISCSGGIESSHMAKRGTAVLSLVRALAGHRPVELYIASTVDADGANNGSTVLTRISTTPIDLAGASFAMASTAYSRHLCYGYSKVKYKAALQWCFGNREATDKFMPALIGMALPHVEETLYIPHAHLHDPLSSKPEQWIEETLMKLGVINTDQAIEEANNA